MSTSSELLISLQDAPDGLSLAELLVLHPDSSRRTAQRWLAELVIAGLAEPKGRGRARRYVAVIADDVANLGANLVVQQVPDSYQAFPEFIPLSADSLDVLRYVDQPVAMRKPVGYQLDFLESYRPNETWYLSASLRRQLHLMGRTSQVSEPAGSYSRAILNRLLIDLSWASSHLEGNTYSRLDTLELIEHGTAAKGKATLETQMILNHKTAIELLVENIQTVGFDRYTLMNLHSALAENLLPNPADEGRLRQHAVEIGLSVFHPLYDSLLIKQMFELMLTKVNVITDPFEQAFFMMVHLPYLQPFADINKRTSRLAANLPLFRANLCPLTFLDVPEQAYSRAILGMYEMTRVELLRDVFVWAYERSTQEYLAIKQNLAQPDPVRLTYRQLIKQCIREVVLAPSLDAVDLVQKFIRHHVDVDNQAEVKALIFEELRRLHEGVLARYGLRPSEFSTWKLQQTAKS
jgi:Fic family protein